MKQGLADAAALSTNVSSAELVNRGFRDEVATDLAERLVARDWH